MKDLIRQGDVLFVPTRHAPSTDTILRKSGSGVIALGEVTGHKHQVATEDLAGGQLYEITIDDTDLRKDGPCFLSVTAEGGISIVHEEHGTVQVPQGDYEIKIAREFDYSRRAARQVAD